MKASLLLFGFLTCASALPQAIVTGQGFTTNPNGPTAEEPCVEGQPLIPDPFLQLYPCTLEEKPAGGEPGTNMLDKVCASDDECSGPWCAGGGASGICGQESKCICSGPMSNEEKEEETDTPAVDKPCDEDEDCPGPDCDNGYCDMGSGKCICPKPGPAENPQPQNPSIDTNSEEWKQVEALEDLDRCVLFELIQCNNAPADTDDFDAWGMCSYQSKEQDMNQCMPVFLNLSKEDQQKKLNEIAEARRKKESDSGQRVDEADRQKDEEERRQAWKDDGAIWVTDQDGANTIVTIGDRKVTFGSVDPWKFIASIDEKCPSPLQGCKAGQAFSEEAVVYLEDYEQRHTASKAQLVMNVDSFWSSTNKIGSRDHLLDAVKKTLDGLNNEGRIERKENQPMFIAPCMFNRRDNLVMCHEANKVYDVPQWTMTDTIQVRVEDPEKSTTIAWLNIGFELLMPETTSMIGFCGGGISAGAGIAAMFAAPGGPAVAAALLIGAVFCNFGS